MSNFVVETGSSLIYGLNPAFAILTACQTLEEKDFKDPASALGHILHTTAADSILAFGYTHRESITQKRSGVAVFARQIIPFLAAKGYQDLVLEIFPKGDPQDAIEQEITAFNQSGKIGREMNRFLQVVDRANFVALLSAAHARGIKIHAGGVTYKNVFQTIWYPNFSAHPQRLQQAIVEVAHNTQDQIRSLVKSGRKKVCSLNGTLHNDLYPRQRNAAASFGKIFPGRLVEIDLAIPELLARNKYYQDLPLSQKCWRLWKAFIPKKGVKLVSERGKNSYLIFWPRP